MPKVLTHGLSTPGRLPLTQSSSVGNHTPPPQKLDASRIPTNWAEDLLLPRQWDANGHAAGIYAPGGWIAKTDPDGKTWEMFSIGYRNCYDIAFNADGELFTAQRCLGVGTAGSPGRDTGGDDRDKRD